MADDCKSDIDEIKQDYNSVREQYKLPSWEELEEDFDISKAFTGEGGIILRDIRRKISEKIASYLHLFETFINPQATPLFLMNSLKILEEKDWENIRRIYNKLAKFQFKQIIVDTIYSQDKEAELIKLLFEMWQEEKTSISDIIQILDKKYIANSNGKSKSYFG